MKPPHFMLTLHFSFQLSCKYFALFLGFRHDENYQSLSDTKEMFLDINPIQDSCLRVHKYRHFFPNF